MPRSTAIDAAARTLRTPVTLRWRAHWSSGCGRRAGRAGRMGSCGLLRPSPQPGQTWNTLVQRCPLRKCGSRLSPCLRPPGGPCRPSARLTTAIGPITARSGRRCWPSTAARTPHPPPPAAQWRSGRGSGGCGALPGSASRPAAPHRPAGSARPASGRSHRGLARRRPRAVSRAAAAHRRGDRGLPRPAALRGSKVGAAPAGGKQPWAPPDGGACLEQPPWTSLDAPAGVNRPGAVLQIARCRGPQEQPGGQKPT